MKKLTDGLREELQEPMGEVLNPKNALERVRKRKGMLVSVGDECGKIFLEGGVKPDLLIYDFKIKRQDVPETTKALLEAYEGKLNRVKNEASTIDPQMEGAVKRGLKGKAKKIFVDGEEDLAALVAMMHANDGVLIAYGQPDQGVVLIESCEKTRNRARGVYRRMIDV